MTFIPFRKSPKCVITDDLFLEVAWEDGKSPEDDSELLGLIEGLDTSISIEKSLPYLTFLQAELLFQALKEAYGHVQLKRVAICHLEGKEAVSEGEVFASPFIIGQEYQNLLLPLIQSIMTSPAFQAYTYQEKREYFVNQVYPAYKSSVGIQESALPLFPEEGEQVSTIIPQRKNSPEVSISATQQSNAKSYKEISFKRVYLLIGFLVALSVGLMISSVISHAQLSKQKEQVTYLHQELTKAQNLADEEHQIDVFSRYFLPNYYSGKKENLKDFLSTGDAKYTVPKEGTLQSVILEKLTYNSKTKEYTPTYVLSIKEGDNVSNIRLVFSIKISRSSKYGYVVTTEPEESDFIK